MIGSSKITQKTIGKFFELTSSFETTHFMSGLPEMKSFLMLIS